ncbi:MAG: flavodoxin domain-containing protein [Candidatus Hodarchaeales archaeon]|jgi:menaquinone-dependent protoporphyrinogen IX oxidase
MNKTILVYITRWGATIETAKEIISVLKAEYGLEVDMVNLKDKKNKKLDISPYENIILGVSVAKFRWAKEGKAFLKKNQDILKEKKLFAFVSSGGAGEAYQEKDYVKYEKLQEKWIDNHLKKYKLEFTSRQAFGGQFVGSLADRGDNRDWDLIRTWASTIGKIISAP